MSFSFQNEKYLSIEELQNILPVHPKTLSRMLKNGKIPGAGKVGKQWYLSETKLKEFLNGVSNQNN